jgi:septal ring factor EnvC (AmiA/AmiB activator)
MKKYSLILLVLSLLFCSSLAFARESYTITGAQVASLSQNLTTLKSLTQELRQKLGSYDMRLQATALELEQSQTELETAKDECKTFILRLNNQQTMLTEQSKSLKSAKVSLKRLRRKDKAKNILFMILIGAAVVAGR